LAHPFKHVYTGVAKTIKRALPLKIIKVIKSIDLRDTPRIDLARDIFMFSFYTRGMSFVDMAYLRKEDLKNGVLTYYRRKTGQLLTVKWETCMQNIVDKYKNETSKFLLPIITNMECDDRTQYRNGLMMNNYNLKRLGEQLGLALPLTMYVARHSWASVAKCNKVPISVISEGMGHGSEMTTQIYLTSLDTSVIDKANSMIIKLL
ncbi:MAG: tyrosine-type recombinase/integrase, partial [Rikenellaceae bacterium]